MQNGGDFVVFMQQDLAAQPVVDREPDALGILILLLVYIYRNALGLPFDDLGGEDRDSQRCGQRDQQRKNRKQLSLFDSAPPLT